MMSPLDRWLRLAAFYCRGIFLFGPAENQRNWRRMFLQLARFQSIVGRRPTVEENKSITAKRLAFETTNRRAPNEAEMAGIIRSMEFASSQGQGWKR